MAEPTSPLMRQHYAVKQEHPEALLFFRVGDFYELFFDDAIVASRELQLTLTSRQKEQGMSIPMCGVPYHAAENYIHRLVRKGYKVAVCDQMEDPKLTKKLVRREVTRILTPGTTADASLNPEENNFLASVSVRGKAIGLAALDLSTGDFRCTEFSGDDARRRLSEELQTLRPRELLYAQGIDLFSDEELGVQTRISAPEGAPQTEAAPRLGSTAADGAFWAETPIDEWVYAPDYAIPQLEKHFGVSSLDGFGLEGKTLAACAAGAILHYLRQTQKGALAHIDAIGYYERNNALALDAVTVRNLELVSPLFAGAAEVTLFRAMDCTLTPMGKRLLRATMLRPSIDRAEIEARLDAIEACTKNAIDREELRRPLDGMQDIERLLSKVSLESANPRDLVALASCFARLPLLKSALERFAAPRLMSLRAELDELADLRERIETTIVDEPPISINDGGLIRSGLHAELDQLRDLSRNGKMYIAQMEQRERERTGIGSLKIKFNNVFGFYIEISKTNLHLAPSDYERKQTLVNAERFTTPELKEYETKVLTAEEKIVAIERELFVELRASLAREARRIHGSAQRTAQIDMLAALAHLAIKRNYCRPIFDDTNEMEVVEGRHPVIEQPEMTGSAERFVANDLYLDPKQQSILLITGPNMGGKSTYLRQTALICLMAQMGSFVPARKARLAIVDRIFTRIGASDNLARGRSTFMVEMTETAAILNTATPNSLILLDEIGRGTATYDGLAIAWAVLEYIHARCRSKTLFATHYHELTDLEELLDSVKNMHVSVKESGKGIVFLRRIEPGAADKSYGIEVAKLAGLPTEVVRRAREVLREHETAEERASQHLHSEGGKKEAPMQLTIFTPLSNNVVDRLREAQLDDLSPRDALNLLYELKRQID